MESFSLLKYWRGTSTPSVDHFSFNPTTAAASTTTTTTVTAITHTPTVAETETDDDNDNDDDGPFFDLEFAVPDEDEIGKEERNCVDESEDEDEENGDSDGEREFNFTLSSNSSNDHTDANLTFSPSDDLFFKGKLVPVESSSLNGASDSEPNSRPQLRVTLLKSAAKFRVFMSGLKKSKLSGDKKTDIEGSLVGPTPTRQEETKEEREMSSENQPPEKNLLTKSKFFAVKFKVEEIPIMSLFTRDNNNNKSQKQSSDDSTAVSEENKFSKDVMQKYLKMVKPLYIRVSRRYGEKLKFSGQLILGNGAKSPPPPPQSTAAPPTSPETETETEVAQPQIPTTNTKSRNMPAKLRVVCKHLGKSRSASSAVAAAPPGPAAPSRRDDSLLQQQDGIQGAILHCKRSFNASRDSESSLLSRSVSDTLRGKQKPSDLTENVIE